MGSQVQRAPAPWGGGWAGGKDGLGAAAPQAEEARQAPFSLDWRRSGGSSGPCWGWLKPRLFWGKPYL